MNIRNCKLIDAPSYFDYWASKSMETQYRHYAAAFGGIPMTMSLRLSVKTLNDGKTTVSVGHTEIRDPLHPIPRVSQWWSSNAERACTN